MVAEVHSFHPALEVVMGAILMAVGMFLLVLVSALAGVGLAWLEGSI